MIIIWKLEVQGTIPFPFYFHLLITVFTKNTLSGFRGIKKVIGPCVILIIPKTVSLNEIKIYYTSKLFARDITAKF